MLQILYHEDHYNIFRKNKFCADIKQLKSKNVFNHLTVCQESF